MDGDYLYPMPWFNIIKKDALGPISITCDLRDLQHPPYRNYVRDEPSTSSSDWHVPLGENFFVQIVATTIYLALQIAVLVWVVVLWFTALAWVLRSFRRASDKRRRTVPATCMVDLECADMLLAKEKRAEAFAGHTLR
ncbi:hypothetical protein HDU88_001657 [Geranomyces variabilis]|nr:hypothetical protein HDU88_001657 [Geranomyces variabilis]